MKVSLPLPLETHLDVEIRQLEGATKQRAVVSNARDLPPWLNIYKIHE